MRGDATVSNYGTRTESLMTVSVEFDAGDDDGDEDDDDDVCN